MSISSPAQQGGSNTPAPQQGQSQQAGGTILQQGQQQVSTTRQPVIRDWASI